MKKIRLEETSNVAYIIMDNKENRHDIDFANEFSETFDSIFINKNIKSIVITSSDEKNFSQGINVEWIKENLKNKNFALIKDFLCKMDEVFKKIVLSCIPTIAQINGHAFGNGALLACACDFRFSRQDRGFFCFPEVDIGIPFLPSMIEYSKKAINYQFYQEIVFSGKRCSADELYKQGVILKSAANLDELKQITFEFAKTLDKNRIIYKKLKDRMFVEIIEAFDKDKQFIEKLEIFA